MGSSEQQRIIMKTATNLAKQQERLQKVGVSLEEVIQDLQGYPYDQNEPGMLQTRIDRSRQASLENEEHGNGLFHTVRERSNRWGQDLIGYGSSLSQALKDRGNQFSQETSEKGDAFTQAVKDRRDKASREVAGRTSDLVDTVKDQTSKLGKNVAERGRESSSFLQKRDTDRMRQERKRDGNTLFQNNRKKLKKLAAEQDKQEKTSSNLFWIALGFGLGLAALGTITYRFLQRRMQQEPEDAAIQLDYPETSNGVVAGARGMSAKNARSTATVETRHAVGEMTEQSTLPTTSTRSETRPTKSSPGSRADANETKPLPSGINAAPKDATFIGIVSNKRYYPVTTPLDQLSLPGGKPTDVIYFTSEAEAKRQGFLAAS